MARKVDKTIKICVICGDKAKGINFNALTCMSCKAFFRRNALRNKEMKCPFNDSCQVDKITRKFCSKCRLKKCFDCGMKKEWILSDEEKRLIKEKIMRNRLRRQQQELEQKQKLKCHIDGANTQHGGGSRRRPVTMRSTSGIRSRARESNQAAKLETASCSTMANSYSQYGCNSGVPSAKCSSTSTSSSGSGAGNVAHNCFTEPSAYSLDILLTSDDSDSLIDPNYSGGKQSKMVADNLFMPTGNEDPFYSNGSEANFAAAVCLAKNNSTTVIDPKRDEFLYSQNEIEDGLRFASSSSLSSPLNDSYGFLFANNIDSIDLFDNELDNLVFSNSSNVANDNGSINYYSNNGISPPPGNVTLDTNSLSSDMMESKSIPGDTDKRYDSTIKSNSPASAGLVEKSGNNKPIAANIKTEENEGVVSLTRYTEEEFSKNDFTQYLLHDNDPFPFQREVNRHNNWLQQQEAAKFEVDQSNYAADVSNNSQSGGGGYQFNSILSTCAFEANRATQYQLDSGTNKRQLALVPMSASADKGGNYIENYLEDSEDQFADIGNFDPVLEIVPRIGDNRLFREIGFSNRELIQPERCLIKELTAACSLLKNPYKRIVFTNFTTTDTIHQCRITEFFIHRLIRMSKRLSSFSQMSLADQVRLLKTGLIEMLCLRSVLLYDPDRDSWNFLDDKCKVSIMVSLNILQPHCVKYNFARHKNYPRLFMNEWKADDIIFDLLTAILLFTPRSGMNDCSKVKEENLRYTYLLRRYLEIKYPTNSEAIDVFKNLMDCLKELRLLSTDVVRFFISISKLHSSPLFAQILDLPSTVLSIPGRPMDAGCNDAIMYHAEESLCNSNNTGSNTNSNTNLPNSGSSDLNPGNSGSFTNTSYPLYGNTMVNSSGGGSANHFRECILNSVN